MPAITTHEERAIPPDAVSRLYAELDWWPERTTTVIAKILETSVAIGAWDGNRLIGFARAVTDSGTRAYIEDVAVLPDHRRRGVGTLLVHRLLEELHDINTVSLFCQPELVSWYEQAGFVARRSQTVMHLRRK